MPRPVFDINEYELRGIVPEVYTEEQRALLNKTLARVNGQIDWSAQMLGFNGPNYWGQANPKADGTYNWLGLPETMNEKRRMQAGAFGVYNKNESYDQWPAPFNRSDIAASGDATIHIWEKDGKTFIGPYGQAETIDYAHDSVFFEGATYIFDAELNLSASGAEDSDIFWSTTFFEKDRVWTRVKVKQAGTFISIKIKDSVALEATVNVIPWTDSSDWSYDQIKNQFLGLWGNKGASPSFDMAFDALDIHGFDERYGLTLTDIKTPLSLEYLLKRVGLETTPWTQFSNTKFGFKIGGCDIAYPIPTSDLGVLYDNNVYDRFIENDDDFLDGGTFENPAPAANVVSEGIYEREIFTYPTQIADNFEFFNCEDDCNYSLSLTQTYSQTEIQGIGSIVFKYETEEDCAKVEFPCVEWVFDPTLDNGEIEEEPIYPSRGPWATANNGEYDNSIDCFANVSQNEAPCDGSSWCGFDDGEFDKIVEPNCDLEAIVQGCLEADGGLYTISGPPDYAACNCLFECCEINNGIYIFGEKPYIGPELADGGMYLIYEGCITHDNDEYGAPTNPVECLLDNGEIENSLPPTETVNSRIYDRVYTDCVECTTTTESPEVIPCPLDPVRVSLEEIFAEATWEMRPAISNSTVPLRLWKSRPLSVLDQPPADGLTQYNFFAADENQGPDELNAYRHFARLPLEYPRDGKFWNRAQAVCNNQSYFSAPPKLSQTRKDPDIVRPKLYSEEYNARGNEDYTIFYEEDFLTSTNTIDQTAPQEGFEDSQISYDDGKHEFALSLITDFDPFSVRVPNEDGEWKGSYYTRSINSVRTGYLLQDIETQSVKEVLYEEFPVSDMSSLKLPDTEFPDSTDEASVKNYVVSYAYFVCDFSAADDPVFDPDIRHCWRQPTIACSTPVDSGNNTIDCEPSEIKTNTAYLLHN